MPTKTLFTRVASLKAIVPIALTGGFTVSFIMLALWRDVDRYEWASENLAPTLGSDGVLWQVQTTLFSVGFAGLAIASQLFAETPLAIGASRDRVLRFIRASWFVGWGLTANALLAIETIWMPSPLGLLFVAIFWVVPSVALLVHSTIRLTRLFGHPSQLDTVVRLSLIATLSERLTDESKKYASANKTVEALFKENQQPTVRNNQRATMVIEMPGTGGILKSVRTKPVKQAFALLSPETVRSDTSRNSDFDILFLPEFTLRINPAIVLDPGRQLFAYPRTGN